MPSPFSIDRRALCQHADYRAVTESSNRRVSMRAYQALLVDTAVRGSDRECFIAKLERVTKQCAAWDERCQVLKEMVASVEAQVKDVCNRTDPNALSEAFEYNATEREDELRQIWRKAAKSEVDGGFVLFCSEDPTCELSFKDIDRSNIPATADTLVSDGIGLQVFLKAGKDSQRLPNTSVGDRTGPSIMSYGRAIEMFGVPDGPGNDWRQASEPSTEPVVREALAQVDITEITSKAEKQEARTEYDYRRLCDWQPPTTPLLSEDQQWALFGSKKHMADAAILARQYAKLVAEKERKKSTKREGVKQVKNGSQDDGSSMASPVTSENPIETTTNSGWPPVEQLDWAGFTNWLSRCKQVDKAFGRETLPSWNKQREQRRATVVAQLKAWVPPEGFDDGSSSHQLPFYNGPPRCILDAKKLGLNLQPAKR
ncbi:uncharacterized protein K460DRAFT_359420 [Cucurbitaria berberidis CBS 394.84]|uniref:Uncharacterized protein n=1 Tax=Cucurbitaria berberidis CBS 394.84 TaxID=1168544 RepID=A0A9P4G8A8_9PLEO|nr:uncharacterized protein K460DRAFT_359420 [Cucurbitaria berberidis CBS 394.84]KAF1840870.1 hypothetical protein K460DRAFT_359420 [Cucurbitaria berberidis CBS 394.84]